MSEQTTEAGRWLEEQEPYLSTWAWGVMGTPIIAAIEAEAAVAAVTHCAGLEHDAQAEAVAAERARITAAVASLSRAHPALDVERLARALPGFLAYRSEEGWRRVLAAAIAREYAALDAEP